MIGQTISHYRITAKLGEGGMGVVYKCEDTKLNRTVALKFLSEQAVLTPEARARFRNEARAAAALDHPNICAIHEIDEVDGHTFIAMAYVDGQSLKEKIASGPLPVAEVRSLGIDIARGLQEAHEKGIVHRDIKSANIMLSSKGQAKVTDFGLAKLAGGTRLTKTGTTLGTVAYMSPEQVAGEKVDHRTDIWSLGVVLFEMLTGRLPFNDEQEQAAAYQIIHEEAEPITAIRTGVPMELERIVRKCLAKDPSNRYQHLDDLLVDLRNLDLSASSRAPESRERRGGRFVLPFAIVVVIAILVTGWRFFRPEVEVYDNPLASATFTQVTDFEASDGAISPDGKFIAFVSNRDGEYDVWVSQVGTGNVFNRTRGEAGDVRASGLRSVGFAGDGSELWIGGGADYGMRIMPLIGGPIRKIFTDVVVTATWSWDGSRVVYRTREAGDPVFVADGDGTNSREILGSEPGMHQHFPSWSPDGQWIYLARGRENTEDVGLWRVRPDGTGLEQLTFGQTMITDPAPIDERTVIYIAKDSAGGGPWLWAVDVETKIARRASIGLERYTRVSASADGRRLVATVSQPEANLWFFPILDRVAQENDVRPYSLPVARALAPRFHSETLFFLSSYGTDDGLWSLRNGQLSEIWSGATTALREAPAVSPDGMAVAIVLRSGTEHRLHVINADGSNLRLVSDQIDVRGSASWSPDGQWLVTGGRDSSGLGLFVIPVDGGAPKRIADNEALHPVWSPRGDMIVYAGKQVGAFSPLLAVRPDGTPFPSFSISGVRGGTERFRFLPDGSGLVYMKGGEPSMDFWLLDLSTMKHRRLTELVQSASMRTFDVTPDGARIVFDRQRDNSEVVLIELPDRRDRD